MNNRIICKDFSAFFVAFVMLVVASAVFGLVFPGTVRAESPMNFTWDMYDYDYGYCCDYYDDYDYGYGDYDYYDYGYDENDYYYDDYDYSYPVYNGYYADYSYPTYSSYSYPTYDYINFNNSYPSNNYVNAYSYPTYNGYDVTYNYPKYNGYEETVKYPTYSTTNWNSDSAVSPIVVASGTRTTPSNTNNVDVTNTNTNNNTNINNINVSATAIAIAPSAPYAYAPVSGYQPTHYQPAYHPAPFCTISVSNNYGAQQTLTWNAVNATSASITPHIGSVPVSGSRVVSSLYGQAYTMTVYGPGGSATCNAQTFTSPILSQANYIAPIFTGATYAPSTYTPTYIPTTGSSAQVALTQIPYTGFDYGPVGNAMYWMSLVLIAVAGAYFLTYHRGGIFALLSGILRRNEDRSEHTLPFPTFPASFVTTQALSGATEGKVGDVLSVVRSLNGTPQIIINRS